MEYSNLSKRIKVVVEKVENLVITELVDNSDYNPFLIYGEDSDKIKRLMVNSIDEAIELAEDEIEIIEDNTKTIVLTFKDKIALNDGIFDTIIYQIYDIDEIDGYSFGQIYNIENDEMVFLNKKIFLGKIRNPLAF